MAARNYKMIAVIAFTLVLSSLSGLNAMAADKGGALAVDNVQVVGNRVVVTITNLSKAPQTGQVAVTAIVGGLVPSRSAQTVKVQPGATVQVPVNFQAFVSNVIVVGISEGGDPIN